MTIRVQPKNYKTYEDFMARMAELRNYLASRNATMAVGNIKAEAIIQDSTKFARLRDQMNKFLALPNIVQDVKEYEEDTTYDVSVVATQTITELQSSIDLIDTSFPEHNGEKLVGHFVNGYWESRVFTPAQTQGLRSAYQLVIDTISES